MAASTLTLTVDATPIVMNCIKDDGYSSEYLFRDATHQYVAKVRHSRTKATSTRPAYDRHNFEVVETIFATGSVEEYERKFYFVQEHLASDTDTDLANAVCDWAIASSDANLISMMGWVSKF